MKHLTTEQAQKIFEMRLATYKPMTWQQVSTELGISAGRIRADRQTKEYLELAYQHIAQYGYGLFYWTLKQAGCLHPDAKTQPETWHGTDARARLEDTGVVYNDGGRAHFDVVRNTPFGYVGDCAVRAMAIAMERDYDSVWQPLNTAALEIDGKSVDNGTSYAVSEPYLSDAGWVKVTFIRYNDAAIIANILQGERAILMQGEHWVASVDGKLHDTWNSGETRDDFDARVYGVWVAADRLATVQWQLRGYLSPKLFHAIQVEEKPDTTDTLPQDCEVERESDAYHALMDAALARVDAYTNPTDADFGEAFAYEWRTLLTERNITITG